MSGRTTCESAPSDGDEAAPGSTRFQAMDARVVAITRERSISARLDNDLLVVFSEPEGLSLRPGDWLRFGELILDAPVRVANLTQDHEFEILLSAADVHDLRLSPDHLGSPTPSADRLHGK